MSDRCAAHNMRHCHHKECKEAARPVAGTVGNWPTDLNGGEMQSLYLDEHLCVRCICNPVCKVSAAIDEGMLTVISRCGMFLDPAIMPE